MACHFGLTPEYGTNLTATPLGSKARWRLPKSVRGASAFQKFIIYRNATRPYVWHVGHIGRNQQPGPVAKDCQRSDPANEDRRVELRQKPQIVLCVLIYCSNVSCGKRPLVLLLLLVVVVAAKEDEEVAGTP